MPESATIFGQTIVKNTDLISIRFQWQKIYYNVVQPLMISIFYQFQLLPKSTVWQIIRISNGAHLMLEE